MTDEIPTGISSERRESRPAASRAPKQSVGREQSDRPVHVVLGVCGSIAAWKAAES